MKIVKYDSEGIRKKLLYVIDKYKITLNTLSKVTGIDINWLSDYINGKREIDDLSDNLKGFFFTDLIFLLSDGMEIDKDERIKGVIDVLVQIFDLKYETISLYAGLEKQDIENFMNDTNSINYEKKYKLAAACMMLHYIFKQPIIYK
ncbi:MULTISPECIES: HTH domain-containing protein [Thermoanaerobacterium]|uniref:HTH domain-containing protein n=1 Tax=Thermoanaerobacterium TaxID=28895 RepID=UPI0017819B0F|nr:MULTISPECIES: HTH domain-containing protein [Thermoanaerobacterium]MBE0069959.1 hypothetical protein [Thermoanaerobacterium thermosaccharolyticum]MBE0229513.1 hypothetical protein [Thermoanaerobacterium thermosaccharolyticum]WKV09935.1 hypothetical protein Q2T46_05760 [Thermoanaerobacterium sp. CMT5567-10]